MGIDMATYKDAINWMAEMDDNLWLGEPNVIPSFTACMVSDIFNKPMEKVIKDLEKSILAYDSLNSGNG